MAYEKIVNLIQKLLLKTRSDQLKWQPTSVTDLYQTSFPNYSVKIGLVEDFETSPYLQFSIVNQEGEIVEEITPSTLRNEHPYPEELLSELLHAARRQALGVDKAIDEILASIDDDIPF